MIIQLDRDGISVFLKITIFQYFNPHPSFDSPAVWTLTSTMFDMNGFFAHESLPGLWSKNFYAPLFIGISFLAMGKWSNWFLLWIRRLQFEVQIMNFLQWTSIA